MSVYRMLPAMTRIPWYVRLRLLFVRSVWTGGYQMKQWRGCWYVLREDGDAE